MPLPYLVPRHMAARRPNVAQMHSESENAAMPVATFQDALQILHRMALSLFWYCVIAANLDQRSLFSILVVTAPTNRNWERVLGYRLTS